MGTITQLPLELGQPIKFETVQDAADWLREKARRDGIDQEIIDDIEATGTCDEQSKSRVLRYSDALGLDPSKYIW